MHIVGIPENSLMISAVAIALLSGPWLSSEQTGTDRNAGPTRVTGHKKIPRLGERYLGDRIRERGAVILADWPVSYTSSNGISKYQATTQSVR